MIRGVREFFSVNGRCREVQLADGSHYPVLLSVEQLPGATGMPGSRARHLPGLRITYRGRRDDLLALGCIASVRLAAATLGRHYDDPLGALYCVEARNAPGRRRLIEVTYLTQARPFANALPGLRTYCADWLAIFTGPPRLRLVVDNTRRELGRAPRPATRRVGRTASE